MAKSDSRFDIVDSNPNIDNVNPDSNPNSVRRNPDTDIVNPNTVEC